MATITPTDEVTLQSSRGRVTWLFTGGDTGIGVRIPNKADITVYMYGTWNGATIALEGSPDDATYMTMDDAFGSNLSFTANDLKPIGPFALYIRPRVTAGTPTAITIVLDILR